MKTLAIALFASLALAGCATDGDEDIRPIDLDPQSQRDLDEVADELRSRADQVFQAPERARLNERGESWAEELIVDNRHWTIVNGPRGTEAIVDELGNLYSRLDLKRPPL